MFCHTTPFHSHHIHTRNTIEHKVRSLSTQVASCLSYHNPNHPNNKCPDHPKYNLNLIIVIVKSIQLVSFVLSFLVHFSRSLIKILAKRISFNIWQVTRTVMSISSVGSTTTYCRRWVIYSTSDWTWRSRIPLDISSMVVSMGWLVLWNVRRLISVVHQSSFGRTGQESRLTQPGHGLQGS